MTTHAPQLKPSSISTQTRAAVFLVLTGICAALHLWKLPPALPQLQAQFNLGLVQSGFLLSVVQMAGMALGLPIGLVAERIGLRRCIVTGLLILAVSSALGAWLDSSIAILLCRALEGCGFLMVTMPVPALIRRLIPLENISRIMGLWSCYMPLGSVLILLFGSWMLSRGSWQLLWVLLAGLTLVFLALTLAIVPQDPVRDNCPPPSARSLVSTTLRSQSVWLIALTFGAYTSQWIAVIGFLPTIYITAGITGTLAGTMTAIVAGVNIIGNLTAGRLLHRGFPAWLLLVLGLATMILCAYAAFGARLPITVQFFAILTFSMVGGLVPATLFVLGLTLAPSPQTTATTIGWMQQCSALGQFIGPPLVAWVVNQAGGDWQWTWVATGGLALLGIILSLQLRHHTRTHPANHGD